MRFISVNTIKLIWKKFRVDMNKTIFAMATADDLEISNKIT